MLEFTKNVLIVCGVAAWDYHQRDAKNVRLGRRGRIMMVEAITFAICLVAFLAYKMTHHLVFLMIFLTSFGIGLTHAFQGTWFIVNWIMDKPLEREFPIGDGEEGPAQR